MEQTHLSSCWLFSLKSSEGWPGSLRCGVFPITAFRSLCLFLSSSWTKMTNIFLCSQRVSLHLSDHVRKSNTKTMSRPKEDFWSLKKATYEWIQMESSSEKKYTNALKLRCKNILFLTSPSLCWQDNRSTLKARCYPRHTTYQPLCRQLFQDNYIALLVKNNPSLIKVVKYFHLSHLFSPLLECKQNVVFHHFSML